MLKRSNKILVGCLALLLVLSVGYAYFSDTITINGAATAKGEFSLTTTCGDDISAVGGNFIKNKGSVTDAEITCEDNVVNASATLGYPGSEKWFRVMVTNTGTIPARLKRVVELNNPDMFLDKDDGWSGFDIENCQGDSTNNACAILLPSQTFWDDYESSEEDWADLIDFWYDEQLDAVLDPGETAYFYVRMYWSRSSIVSGEPLTPTLNAKITWEQVTVN